MNILNEMYEEEVKDSERELKTWEPLLNKLIQKYHGTIAKESYQCLKHLKENHSLAIQNMNLLEKPSTEYSPNLNPKMENHNSKPDSRQWIGGFSDSTKVN